MQSIGNLLWRPTFDPLAITTMRLVAANKCRLLGAGDFPSLRVANGTFKCSWTYSRSRGFTTNLDGLGRLATSSAFHCATDARYSNLPPRVAALRVSSLDTVDGLRPIRRAISRTPISCARSNPISSRWSNDRYLLDTGLDINNGMPPRCLNQRAPTACDAPTASAAFSLVMPLAI